MVTDLNEARELYHNSVAAFIAGDPDAQKPLWSPRDDVTLANPLGPPAKGFEQVCQVIDAASTQIGEGEGYTFDSITVIKTADLAYEVGIERSRIKLGDSPEKVPVSLRVTTIFRREDGEWKIVHRHADPITEKRSIDSVAPPGLRTT
jgi:ketosteroid isomerase-like protein